MIPPLLHFIWVQVSKPFGRLEYLSIKSALKKTPYKIILHTNLQPGQAGIYCPYSLLCDRFTLDCQPFFSEYRGIKLRASMIVEILRIQILQSEGGIYSDLDMIWFNPIPFDLSQVRLLAPWQNQSYKIVGTYLLGSEKGYDFSEIFTSIDATLDTLKKKGITSLEGLTLREYLIINDILAKYFRDHADFHLKKCYFEKNTWKNIWRFLTNQLPEEKIILDGICGIHISACGLFGQYKTDTTELLTKHTKLKQICDALEN